VSPFFLHSFLGGFSFFPSLFHSFLHSFGYCFHIFRFFSCLLLSFTFIHLGLWRNFLRLPSSLLHSFIPFEFSLSSVLLVSFTFLFHSSPYLSST
jgi:hypothetical protein